MTPRLIDVTDERDIAASLALFQTVYGRPMTDAFYRWRFVNNPFGPPMVSLLWDGEILAGHYSVSPGRTSIDGQIVRSAQSMTTMTHPAYRNRGIFTQLAAHLYSAMTDMGVGLVWGIPNVQSHYGFVQKLEWQDVGLIATMTRTIRDDAPKAAASLRERTSLPEAIDALCERALPRAIYPSKKDSAYFTWRYLDNPAQKYALFTLGASDDLFLVTKEYESPHGRALEIVDYVFAEAEAFALGMRAILELAAQRGFAMVRSWMSVTHPAFPELERLGFQPREPIAYFSGRTLGQQSLSRNDWDVRRWCVTMGNSDNY